MCVIVVCLLWFSCGDVACGEACGGACGVVCVCVGMVSILVGCEERVSRVERVVSVGVTDVSSLVVLCLTRRRFVRVFLCLCALGLFHRRYK